MKFKVLSRQAFEEFKSDEAYIAISITDPNSEDAIIGDTNNLHYILTLQFHDVDKPLVKRKECTMCEGTGYLEIFADVNNGHCYSCTDKMDIKLFNDENAKTILDFVETYKKGIDFIVVHCEAGISRSAGVAGALSLIYNGTDKEFFEGFFKPNMLMYRKILNIYHLQMKYKNNV